MIFVELSFLYHLPYCAMFNFLVNITIMVGDWSPMELNTTAQFDSAMFLM